jgi:type I pantothenate kinase
MDQTPTSGARVDRVTGPYQIFQRAEWAALRANTPLVLSDADLKKLCGVNEPVSLADVADIYLPLSRFLNLQVMAARSLHGVIESAFLGRPSTPTPYIIGVAGSVAVGKSTFARVLQAMLAQWPAHPRVDLVTTDGFLLNTRTLSERGLMRRKGFPESYDLRRMLKFLSAAKTGARALHGPVYSHEAYDIVSDRMQLVEQPDILIFEGLNVLQTVSGVPAVISDFFDFSIYLDADTAMIEEWYVQRFLLLQRTVFQRPSSYFHHYKDQTHDEAVATARQIWSEINLPNLRDNIRPTRERARLVVRKGDTHAVDEIWLRRS